MKSIALRVCLGIIFIITILGVLRFKPWKGGRTDSIMSVAHDDSNQGEERELSIGFLPVTCHLTCPVTDYASKTTKTKTKFNSRIFSDFPTIVSAMQSKQIQATFMIVPLAMKLREQGAPVKICYLGHRDGSEVVVGKYSGIRSMKDLKGKRIGIPSQFSNQRFVLTKLMRDYGMTRDDVKFIVLPPPEMPTSLAAGAIDAYFVGEPFCAKAELDGTGRVLYYARDIWPNFISCALVVHEDLMLAHPDLVSDLVRGIAESGEWAETHRADAAKLVAPYFRQNEKVLNYVLTAEPKRVSYVNLNPSDEDLKMIQDIGIELNVLTKAVPMNELIDRRFIPKEIEAAPIDVSKIPDNN